MGSEWGMVTGREVEEIDRDIAMSLTRKKLWEEGEEDLICRGVSSLNFSHQ